MECYNNYFGTGFDHSSSLLYLRLMIQAPCLPVMSRHSELEDTATAQGLEPFGRESRPKGARW